MRCFCVFWGTKQIYLKNDHLKCLTETHLNQRISEKGSVGGRNSALVKIGNGKNYIGQNTTGTVQKRATVPSRHALKQIAELLVLGCRKGAPITFFEEKTARPKNGTGLSTKVRDLADTSASGKNGRVQVLESKTTKKNCGQTELGNPIRTVPS